MDIRPVKTETDYESALREIEALMDAAPGTPEHDRLDILATLVSRYEEEHFPLDAPDPVEAILFRMDQMGLKQSDLARILGSQSRASEILNRKRGLNLSMIRRLTAALGIPAGVLVQDYKLST